MVPLFLFSSVAVFSFCPYFLPMILLLAMADSTRACAIVLIWGEEGRERKEAGVAFVGQKRLIEREIRLKKDAKFLTRGISSLFFVFLFFISVLLRGQTHCLVAKSFSISQLREGLQQHV